MHPLAVPSGRDDACASQVGEMTRDLGLSLLKDFDKVANAYFLLAHQIKQAQAGGIS
jgi:hypothetical protein